jgi:pimeloyl-ACP methyl ester carboxylesterase
MSASRWLLLRGLTREQRHWGAFPRVLAQALDTEVACLDLPGFGTEHARRSPASVAGMTDDLRRRLDAVRGDATWSIFGISLGGMVALDWCARFPGDFERCVVVNTSANLSPTFDRVRLLGLSAFPASLFGSPLAKERAALRVSSNLPRAERDALASQHARWRKECPPSLASALCQMIAARRFRLPDGLRTPLLVMGSTADGLVSHRCSRAIAHALRAPLRMHDHWTCAEMASWIVATDATRGAPQMTPPPEDRAPTLGRLTL